MTKLRRNNPLMNLADALVEDILNMTDEDILAESSPEEIAKAKLALERARAAIDGEGVPDKRGTAGQQAR